MHNKRLMFLAFALTACGTVFCELGDTWIHLTPNFGTETVSPRTYTRMFISGGKFFLIGGEYFLGCDEDFCYPTTYLNDVWTSSDGENWSRQPDLPVPPNTGFILQFGSKLSLYYGDSVWSSIDGSIWNDEIQHGTVQGGWPIIYNGKLWTINTSVARSDDALNWFVVAENVPSVGYPVVFHSKIWDISFYTKSAWSTSDGLTWLAESDHLNIALPPIPPGTPPGGPTFNSGPIIELNNILWEYGHYFYVYPNFGTGEEKQTLLSSSDGINWIDHTNSTPYGIQHDPIAYNHRLWINLLDYSEETRAAKQHATDTNNDAKLGLDELLRAIQLYSVGSFHCNGTTEDGYKPGPGVTTCQTYSADYDPQDWRISFEEILRLIQLYNSNGYHPCPDGEDHFCPGR